MITYAAAGGGGGKRGTGRLPERSRDAFAFFNASDDDEKSEGVEKKRGKPGLGIFHQRPTAVGPTTPPTKTSLRSVHVIRS